MRIRFVTKDNLRVIVLCRNVDEPPVAIDRPIIPDPHLSVIGEEINTNPIGFRRYEYRGEIINGIPTLNEI